MRESFLDIPLRASISSLFKEHGFFSDDEMIFARKRPENSVISLRNSPGNAEGGPPYLTDLLELALWVL